MAAPAVQSPRGKKEVQGKAADGEVSKPTQPGRANVHPLPRPVQVGLPKSESPRAVARKVDPRPEARGTVDPKPEKKPNAKVPTQATARAALENAKTVKADRESSLIALSVVAHERAALLASKSRHAPPAPPRAVKPAALGPNVARAKRRMQQSSRPKARPHAHDVTDHNVQILSSYETPPVPTGALHKEAAADAVPMPPPLPTRRADDRPSVREGSEVLTSEEVTQFVRPVLPRGRILAMGGLVAIAAAVAMILPMWTSQPSAHDERIKAAASTGDEAFVANEKAPGEAEIANTRVVAPIDAQEVEPANARLSPGLGATPALSGALIAGAKDSAPEAKADATLKMHSARHTGTHRKAAKKERLRSHHSPSKNASSKHSSR